MKIGLLGGSFNPIHNGHIKIAKTVLEKTEIEQIWFIPTGNHPLKSNNKFKPIEKRILLIEKAIEKYSDFFICKFDSNDDNPNYTSQLISRLKQEYPADKFYFIAGYDIVAELPLWHEYRWLLNNIKFIIINRPHTDMQSWGKLNYLDKLQFIEMEPIDVSSSEIRSRIAEKKEIKELVPERILEDILEYYL